MTPDFGRNHHQSPPLTVLTSSRPPTPRPTEGHTGTREPLVRLVEQTWRPVRSFSPSRCVLINRALARVCLSHRGEDWPSITPLSGTSVQHTRAETKPLERSLTSPDWGFSCPQVRMGAGSDHAEGPRRLKQEEDQVFQGGELGYLISASANLPVDVGVENKARLL